MSADVPRSFSVSQAQTLSAPATVPIRVAMMYLTYRYLSLLLRWSGVIAPSVAREAVRFPRKLVPNIERNARNKHSSSLSNNISLRALPRCQPLREGEGVTLATIPKELVVRRPGGVTSKAVVRKYSR
jgi:hypothetical protein